uniref:Uncharacterized protein n=1 Tax=Lepeophtheirus salmonis TaxID=72036 RepID=A0A0K2UEW2_LEPSM
MTDTACLSLDMHPNSAVQVVCIRALGAQQSQKRV